MGYQGGPPYQMPPPGYQQPFAGAQTSGTPYPASTPPYQGQPSTPPYQAAGYQPVPYQQPGGGQWQPPQPPPPGPRNSTPWIFGGVGAVIVICLIVILVVVLRSSGDDVVADPTATKSATSTSTATGSAPTATATATSSPKSTVNAIDDICSKIEVTALGDWAESVEATSKSNSEIADYSSIASCSIDLESASGDGISLSVSIAIYTAKEDAVSYFATGLKYDKTSDYAVYDGEITDLGDEAYGTNSDDDYGLLVSTYTTNVRSANLILTVDISSYADAYVAKDTIKTKCVDETKSILALF